VPFLILLRCLCRCVSEWSKSFIDQVPPLPSSVRIFFQWATSSHFFEVFSISVIVANAIALGLERFNMPHDEVVALRNANYALTLLFGGMLETDT
jgi:hypothetical protein